MSYCVNCGVELADSEKRCPLCDVEVHNPLAPWQEPTERPYSRHVDTLMRKIDRRYLAMLIGLMMLIPCIITVLLDFISGGGLTWSAYVIGAIALIYIFVLLPFYFKKRHPVIFLSLNCAATLLYLLFIQTANGGNWFMGLGLPLTVAASVCVIVPALLFTSIRPSIIVRTGTVFIAVGVFVVCAEVFISLFAYHALRFAWSLYALIPCVMLGVAAFVLERWQNFKELVRRRLFY